MGMKEEAAKNAVNVEHDKLITEIMARAAEEHERGSDASESAAKVKEFLEATNLNSQAFSWAKTILKKLPKKDGSVKAMDVIRSLETVLPMLRNHIVGQSTADMGFGDEASGDGGSEPETQPEDGDGAVKPIEFDQGQAAAE